MRYPITFRQLVIFREVARSGSFTLAAKQLHLSQPAISMQVKQMEHLIDSPLTERIGKKIRLTEIGNIVLDYSEKILANKEAMEQTITSMLGTNQGTFQLAVPDTANQFVTLLLARFRKAHPGITIHLQIHNRAGLLQALENNTTDMVIMGQPPKQLELIATRFMSNPLVAIGHPENPLCHKQQIPLSEVVSMDFVVRELGSGTRIAMKRFFENHDLHLNNFMEMPNNEAIKQAVAAGLGLGIVSLHTLQQELALNQVKVLDVQHLPILRQWFIVYRKQRQLSPAMQLFRAFAIEETKEVWLKKYPELRSYL